MEKRTKENTVKYRGMLVLAGYKVPCFVTEDGKRWVSNSESQDSLGMTDKGDKQKSGTRFDRYLNQKSLQPYLYKGKEPGHYDPTIIYDGNQKISGRKATTLVDFSDAILEARNYIPLSSRQEIIAKQCEVLVRAFAKTGINALIDEATGYQEVRGKFELRRVFNLLILEDGIFSETKRFFPLGYYKDMFGVYNIDFTPENIRRKPRFIGWLTNELVYKNLPAGSFVLKKIKERTPKTKGGNPKYRQYRSLTSSGEKALMEVIGIVRTLAWICKNDRNKLHSLVKERFKLENELPYIDVEAMDDNKDTDFDKIIDVALNSKPIKQKDLKIKTKKKK